MARDPIGFIYFIQAPINGRIKIGYSASHPEKRIRNIEAMSPVDLVPLAVARGLQAHETALHGLFAAFLAKGEWFEGHDLILTFAREMATPWAGVDALVADRPTEIQAVRFMFQWPNHHAAWARTNGLDPAPLEFARPYAKTGKFGGLTEMSRTFRFQRPLSKLPEPSICIPPQGHRMTARQIESLPIEISTAYMLGKMPPG